MQPNKSECEREREREGENTVGHVQLNELEILKSDALFFVKWVHHIHVFLVQQLFAEQKSQKQNRPNFKKHEKQKPKK